jgi:hypothetical protein
MRKKNIYNEVIKGNLSSMCSSTGGSPINFGLIICRIFLLSNFIDFIMSKIFVLSNVIFVWFLF